MFIYYTVIVILKNKRYFLTCLTGLKVSTSVDLQRSKESELIKSVFFTQFSGGR